MLIRLAVFNLLLAASTLAQPPSPAGAILSTPSYPQPVPADVDSVDHILTALYDVISGPAHQPRNWNGMRSLFIPGAPLIPTLAVPASPAPHPGPANDVLLVSIDAFIARSEPRMLAQGFYERPIHNQVDTFGSLVHVFSTYESRHTPSDPQPFARGINSFQLLYDGSRYWIVGNYWAAETPAHPIPAAYLPAPLSGSGLTQNLNGAWVGQLEYRDYSSNQRVSLPTWLTLAPAPAGSAVIFNYTYDDGPNKTVREQTTLSLDTAGNTGTFTTPNEPATTYFVAGFDTFSKQNRGTLVLTGKGTENKLPVEVRITLTLGRNRLTLLKETRPPNDPEFKFRDAHTFTRATPPAGS